MDCIFAYVYLIEGEVQGALPVLGTIKLKHCVSNDFLLTDSHVQGPLQKELNIAPFVERFKITTLGKSS